MVLCLFVISPRCQSDASMVMETTLRGIQYAMDACKEKGVPRPREILLWET